MPIDPIPTIDEINDWNTLLSFYNTAIQNGKITYKKNGKDVTIEVPNREALDKGDVSNKIYEAFIQSSPNFGYDKQAFVTKMQNYYRGLQQNSATANLKDDHGVPLLPYDPKQLSNQDAWIGSLTSQYHIPTYFQDIKPGMAVQGRINGVYDPYATDGNIVKVATTNLTNSQGQSVLQDPNDPFVIKMANNKVKQEDWPPLIKSGYNNSLVVNTTKNTTPPSVSGGTAPETPTTTTVNKTPELTDIRTDKTSDKDEWVEENGKLINRAGPALYGKNIEYTISDQPASRTQSGERLSVGNNRYVFGEDNTVYKVPGQNTFEVGGQLSSEKARKILHDGTIYGRPITEKQRKFFGAVASGYIKEKGGYLEYGGKMYEKGGSDIDFEDADIEAIRGGNLENISADIVKVKGNTHKDGGVGLNTGDEVEKNETINTEKGWVFGNIPIDDATIQVLSAVKIPVKKGMEFKEAHELLAKEIKRTEKSLPEKWASRKIDKLKETEKQMFQNQQALNGDDNGNKMAGGGEIGGDGSETEDPYRYFIKADGSKTKIKRTDESKIQLFEKSNPDSKEVKIIGNKIYDINDPLVLGQKKNRLGEASPNIQSFEPTVIKIDRPKFGSIPVNPNVEEIRTNAKVKVGDNYNDFLEPENQQKVNIGELIPGVDFDKKYSENVTSIIDPKNEDFNIWEDAAREKRDEDNHLVVDLVFPELLKREQDIVNTARTLNGADGSEMIQPENIQQTTAFKNVIDDYLNGYKGMKIKRPDGSILNTDKITPSQQNEIRNELIRTYQIKKQIPLSTDKVKESLDNVILGKKNYETIDDYRTFLQGQVEKGEIDKPTYYRELDDYKKKVNAYETYDPLIKQIKGFVDQGIIPILPEDIDPILNKVEAVNDKFSTIYAGLEPELYKDSYNAKLEYQQQDALFVNQKYGELEKLKVDLEAQVQAQQISPEDANNILNQSLQQIEIERSQNFLKVNESLNKQNQFKIDATNKAYKDAIIQAFVGTPFEGKEVTNDMIQQSLLAGQQLVYGQVEKDQTEKIDYLNKLAFDDYQNKTYGEKMGAEITRGTLMNLEGIGGMISYLGGFETGNALSDLSKNFNVTNPQHDTGNFRISQLMNPDWWISDTVSSFTAMIESIAPIVLAPELVGLGALEGSIGATGTNIVRSTLSGTGGRVFQATIEAGGHFNDMIANGVSTEEASQRAANTFTNNLELIFTDVGQFMMAFTPMGRLGVVGKLAKIPLQIGAEGGEEVLQGYWRRDNPYQTFMDYATSPGGIKEFVTGGIMGLAFAAPDVASIVSGSGKKWNEGLMYDLMLQTNDMSKRYEDLIQTATILRDRGQLNAEEFQNVISNIEFTYNKGSQIPVNLTVPQKQQVLSLLSDIDQLEKTKAQTTDETLIKIYDNEIKDLQKRTEETMAGKEPMYFIGKVPYTKEQFEQLTNDPQVLSELQENTTTFNVVNDPSTLETTIQKIEAFKNQNNQRGMPISEQKGEEINSIQSELKEIESKNPKSIEAIRQSIQSEPKFTVNKTIDEVNHPDLIAGTEIKVLEDNGAEITAEYQDTAGNIQTVTLQKSDIGKIESKKSVDEIVALYQKSKSENINPELVSAVESAINQPQIKTESIDFVNEFNSASSYTGLRKTNEMEALKEKDPDRFEKLNYINDNFDEIVQKLNIQKDCK